MSMESWKTFFPFEASTKYLVDGPLTYNGTGETLANMDPILEFTMNMPAYGPTIPALALTLKLTYVNEGDGNMGEVEVNGRTYTDANVHITSDVAKKKRRIVPSISTPEMKLQMLEFGPRAANRISMAMTIDGKSHGFDLNRM